MPKEKDYDEYYDILEDDLDEPDNEDDEDKTEDDYLSPLVKKGSPSKREADLVDFIGDKLDDWITGKELVPEKKAQEFLNSVGDKAKLVNSLVVLNGMKRIKKLNEFVSAMEEDLFDSKNIEIMSPKQKISVYRTAVNRINEIMENNNAYIKNADTGMDEETQRIITLAKSVTPETRDKLISMLKDINKDGSDV